MATIIGWVLFDPVLSVIMAPACDLPDVVQLNSVDGECRLLALRPLEPFSVRIRVSLLTGLFVAGPILFYQLWKFITPGLTQRERRLSLPFVVLSQLMFAFGIVFAYVIIPQGLNILLSMGGDNFAIALTGTEYLSFFLRTSVAFGLVFEIPLVLVFLSLLGIVTSSAMRKARPWAIVANVAVAAVVTPTTDPVTLLFMAVPMVVFYELAILVAWLIERSRRRRREEFA